jgi:hypothetical protein
MVPALQMSTIYKMDSAVKWRTYPVTYKHLRPVLDVNLFNNTEEGLVDWRLLLKDYNVLLGPNQIERIVGIVQAHLSTP